jgi:hypothetical protein
VTVIAVRPIYPASGSGQRDWRAGVLTALGQAARPSGPGLYEFIVRDQSGATLSVVQRDKDGLQPGQPALMLPGPRARLTPART